MQDENMDFTVNRLPSHARPDCEHMCTDAKVPRLEEEDGNGKGAESKRLSQLEFDIRILGLAIHEGRERIRKMSDASGDIDPLICMQQLSHEIDLLMADLRPEQRRKAKEFEEDRVQRTDDGSLNIILWGQSTNDNPSSVKVEAWELKKCGCSFCVSYGRSPD